MRMSAPNRLSRSAPYLLRKLRRESLIREAIWGANNTFASRASNINKAARKGDAGREAFFQIVPCFYPFAPAKINGIYEPKNQIVPKSEILPLFNFSLVHIYHLSILAGRKDKRNDLKKNFTSIFKNLFLRALGCQNDLSLTFKKITIMKTYQVITITDKKVIVEKFDTIEDATKFFRIAKYGYSKEENVETIYLTENNEIVTTLTTK